MTIDTRPAIALTIHEHIGFELGWDYAHHRLLPPAPYGQEPSPLRHGLLAGQAAFGARTLAPTTPVRRWLQLRLNAWLRGRSVELFQVTPHYLAQLDASHCPITREPLGQRRPAAAAAVPGTAASDTAPDTTAGADAPPGVRATPGTDGAAPCAGATGADTADTSIDRVRNDAGYAAGNLVVMSTRANHAKAAHGFRDARQLARQAAAEAAAGTAPARPAGLTATQWSRVATLCSFVEPLDHDEACSLPLLLLPPNRLRLFNPAQALQALISQQLLTAGWSRRSRHIEQLVPGKPARRAFQAFFHALLPRVLEAGGQASRPAGDPRGTPPHAAAGPCATRSGAERQHARWAVEDAWQNPLVLARWTVFARQLTAAQCESLVLRAHARRLSSGRVERLPEGAATEGWNLESRGYVPHAVLMRRGTPPAPAATLPRPAPRSPSGPLPSPLQARLPL